MTSCTPTSILLLCYY